MDARFAHMNAEQLAAEEAVQGYVLRAEQAKAWDSWLLEHPELAREMNEARLLIRELDSLSQQSLPGDDQALDKLWDRIAADTQSGAKVISLRQKVQQRRWRSVAAWAAAAAAVLWLALWFSQPAQSFSTEAGQFASHMLPDSSMVWLGPSSKLKVESFDQGAREVFLSGEAYFEVSKGSRFTVKTSEGEVAVLGTAFRVDASARELSVAVAEGRVEVSRQAESTILQAGEAVASDGKGLKEKISIEVQSLKPGAGSSIYLYDVPVPQAVEVMERYYGRELSLASALRNRSLSIELPTRDWQAALDRLSFVLQVPIDSSGNRIIIGQ